MPSCTFMDIAKRYGVDYGDVLMATECYRPNEPLPCSEHGIDAMNARHVLPRPAREEIARACNLRWKEEP